jgi:hypothetical protein
MAERTLHERRLEQATEELGYRREPPSPALRVKGQPAWTTPVEEDPIEVAVNNIVEEGWPVRTLREQIRKLGVKPQGRSRAELAHQLVSTFMDPGRLEMVVAGLSEEAQNLYAQMLFNVNTWRLRPEYEGLSLLLGELDSGVAAYEELRDAVLGLEMEGQLMVPPALFSRLPPIHLTVDLGRDGPVGSRHEVHPHRLVTQLQQLLGLIRSRAYPLGPRLLWSPPMQGVYASPLLEKLTPTPVSVRSLWNLGSTAEYRLELMAPEPRPAKETLEAWCHALAVKLEEAEFLYELLRAVGVLRPGSPITTEPVIAERFLALSPGEQLALLLREFRSLEDWAAFWPLWREGEVRTWWQYRPYRNYWSYTDTLGRLLRFLRQVTFEFLAFLPHDSWLALGRVNDFLSTVLLEDASPVRALSLSGGGGGWEGFVRRYLTTLLEGPLHWLGFCDVERDGAGVVQAFRLHHLQGVLWDRLPALPISEVRWEGSTALRWQSEGQALLLEPPVPVPVLRQVQRWSEPDGADGEILRYHLDVERLHASFEIGESPESLLEGWQESTDVALPRPITAWWERWWGRYGRVRLYPNQAVLAVEDAFTMQELQVALPQLPEALRAVLNSTTALLEPQGVDALREALEDKGYMPKVLDPSAGEEGA